MVVLDQHGSEVRKKNYEAAAIAMISMLGCVFFGTVIYFTGKWVADCKESRRQLVGGY